MECCFLLPKTQREGGEVNPPPRGLLPRPECSSCQGGIYSLIVLPSEAAREGALPFT